MVSGGPSERYKPQSLEQALGYLAEECGETMAALGKSIRWGLDAVNPELPPEEQETNQEWLVREMADLHAAIGIVHEHLRIRALPVYADGWREAAEQDQPSEWIDMVHRTGARMTLSRYGDVRMTHYPPESNEPDWRHVIPNSEAFDDAERCKAAATQAVVFECPF